MLKHVVVFTCADAIKNSPLLSTGSFNFLF